MIMDELFMQSDGRNLYDLHGIYNNIADGGILIAVISFKRKGPGSGWHVAELVLTAPERYRVQRVGPIDGFHQSAGAMWQNGTFQFGHHLVIEDNDKGIEVEGAAPEKDRAVQVEVQPEFQFVIRHVSHIGPAYVDGEKGRRTEDNQRKFGRAIDKDLIVASKEDADLKDLST